MPSFDVIIEVDKVELRNAIDQSNKEISNRFDFKGSDARIEISDDKTLSIYADDEFKMNQVFDLMIGKMTKREIDIRSLTKQKLEKISGDKVKQSVTILSGIDKDLAKKIVKTVKDNKLKAQGSIQGDIVRFSGSKRDALQAVISLLKNEISDVPLQYKNFRD
ncbi:MAG: YajQ family cyclic di-GMP-binding protein [Burkholderiales bacterium]|nr:YajQ family cyclic di-GMP-binding protein [Burkholderiales bacterium]OUT77629.1 MAG: YajQ family cyclic di-GMP-binding protein [Betaproteobacteria bacterium TMED22]|tara:strand:- start:21628 stop:22116 length:489 start_codon:yes stop_codon:yes gene_type:complete